MIRAVTPGKDGPVIVLGLTRENVDELEKGHPIALDLAQFGIAVPDGRKVTFTILLGETHEAVIDELEGAGVKMPEGSRQSAVEMDDQLRRERGG